MAATVVPEAAVAPAPGPPPKPAIYNWLLVAWAELMVVMLEVAMVTIVMWSHLVLVSTEQCDNQSVSS